MYQSIQKLSGESNTNLFWFLQAGVWVYSSWVLCSGVLRLQAKNSWFVFLPGLWTGGKSTAKLSQVPGRMDAPADTGLRALDSLPATPRGHLHLLLQDSCLLRQESLGAWGMPCYVMQSWVWHPATLVIFHWAKQTTNTIVEGRGPTQMWTVECRLWWSAHYWILGWPFKWRNGMKTLLNYLYMSYLFLCVCFFFNVENGIFILKGNCYFILSVLQMVHSGSVLKKPLDRS